MITLLLTMALGGLLGFLFQKKSLPFLPSAAQWTIRLLLFSLGLELGSNETVLGKIGTLGWMAAAITTGALLGSLLMAALMYKKFFTSLEGNRIHNSTTDNENPEKNNSPLYDSVIISASFFAGFFCSACHFFTASAQTAKITLWLLYLLLLLVGMSIGKEKSLFVSIKQHKFRFLLLPMGTLIGTLAGAALVGVLLPNLTLWDSLAVSSGMGYYSLSSVLLSHSRGAEIGSIALMSNIMREFSAVLFAPFLVKVFGKLAPIAAGGATTMDITLPVILRYSGKEYLALAVFHGAILDLSVPVLVGFFGSL